MKFNLNHKELVALYDLLQITLNSPPSRTVDDVQLRQVHSRLKACIVNALEFPKGWAAQVETDDLPQPDRDCAERKFISSAPPRRDPPDRPTLLADILNDDDDEVGSTTSYPKKGAPAPNMPRPGKHHRKNRH